MPVVSCMRNICITLVVIDTVLVEEAPHYRVIAFFRVTYHRCPVEPIAIGHVKENPRPAALLVGEPHLDAEVAIGRAGIDCGKVEPIGTRLEETAVRKTPVTIEEFPALVQKCPLELPTIRGSAAWSDHRIVIRQRRSRSGRLSCRGQGVHLSGGSDLRGWRGFRRRGWSQSLDYGGCLSKERVNL